MLSSSYPPRTMAYAVRSGRVGAPGFMHEVQQAVWSVNPNLPLAAVQTLDEVQARSMVQTSFAMAMLAIAATVALLLGVVGIYGVVALHGDAADPRDRHPHGARGADPGRADHVSPPWASADGRGIALGVVIALVLTRVMAALLFGIGPMDPDHLCLRVSGSGSGGVGATYLPARRASRVDPVVALHADV